MAAPSLSLAEPHARSIESPRKQHFSAHKPVLLSAGISGVSQGPFLQSVCHKFS